MGWTDCEQSLSLGTVLKGTSWGRPNDRIGAAGVIEGLSAQARVFRRRRPRHIDRRWPAQLSAGEDIRGVLRLWARQMDVADLRLSVHPETGLQPPPRAGLNLCPEVP